MTKLLNSRISTLIFSKAELQGRALSLSVRKKRKSPLCYKWATLPTAFPARFRTPHFPAPPEE